MPSNQAVDTICEAALQVYNSFHSSAESETCPGTEPTRTRPRRHEWGNLNPSSKKLRGHIKL